jgi:hypothetical protein
VTGKNEKPIESSIGFVNKYEFFLTFFGEKLLNLSDSGGTDIKHSPTSGDE